MDHCLWAASFSFLRLSRLAPSHRPPASATVRVEMSGQQAPGFGCLILVFFPLSYLPGPFGALLHEAVFAAHRLFAHKVLVHVAAC